MLNKYMLNERMNEWLALEKYDHDKTLEQWEGVVEEQNEGGAHAICLTDLASFWGINSGMECGCLGRA